MTNRYKVPYDEDLEPHSDGVLKNHLGIKKLKIIEQLEANELERVGLDIISLYNEKYQFTAEDICNIHELWLGNIYPSAGKYRTVSMSKNGFLFANPQLIPGLMSDLENNFLKKYTPCYGLNDKDLAEALGIVHVELIIIHPFREGNGRTARILSNLMALQSGKNMLDYSLIDRTQNKNGYENYINAIHDGIEENYGKMIKIFFELLQMSHD